VAAEVEWIDASSFIRFIFLKEGPARKGGFAQIAEKS